MIMKTMLRTFVVALLATSVSSFAQPSNEKCLDNNPTTTTQNEVKQNTKKQKKQAKPAKTNDPQEKAYDPTAGIWG
jgi:hypothetical protein